MKVLEEEENGNKCVLQQGEFESNKKYEEKSHKIVYKYVKHKGVRDLWNGPKS